MRIQTFIIIIFLTFGLFAEKNVTVDNTVNKFFNDLNYGTDNYHRSGFSLDKSSVIPEKAKKSWKSTPLLTYRIIDNGAASKKIRDSLFESQILEKRKYIVRLFDEKSELLIEKKSSPKPSDILREGGLDKNDYKVIAENYLSAIDEFNGKIEVENIAFETSECLDCNDDFYNQEHISGIYIRFRRLFQGGIVRRGISKVVVKLDPDGSLRSLKSKWPEFKENKAVENKISYCKSINDLVDELANNNKAHLVGNMTTWEIDEYNLSGAAKAWIPVYDSNENVILIPSISYIVEVYFGEHLTTRILDYPLSETYINQFIKCDM
jgi:hypothetical protein